MSTSHKNQLYCICRSRKSDNFMIACDECEEWFHAKCLRIYELNWKLIHWSCSKCIDNRERKLEELQRQNILLQEKYSQSLKAQLESQEEKSIILKGMIEGMNEKSSVLKQDIEKLKKLKIEMCEMSNEEEVNALKLEFFSLKSDISKLEAEKLEAIKLLQQEGKNLKAQMAIAREEDNHCLLKDVIAKTMSKTNPTGNGVESLQSMKPVKHDGRNKKKRLSLSQPTSTCPPQAEKSTGIDYDSNNINDFVPKTVKRWKAEGKL